MSLDIVLSKIPAGTGLSESLATEDIGRAMASHLVVGVESRTDCVGNDLINTVGLEGAKKAFVGPRRRQTEPIKLRSFFDMGCPCILYSLSRTGLRCLMVDVSRFTANKVTG